jgi:hypothetical protein
VSTDEKAELVLALHGTFAGRRTGKSWWEPEGDFAPKLAGLLEAARPATKFEFRSYEWDPDTFGANLESVRRAAGRKLLLELRDLGDRPYHLIGHSHGGSVIWHALVESMGDGQGPLKGLRSWTTVGTPFMIFRPLIRSIWPIVPILTAILALILWGNAFLPLADRLRLALRFAPNFIENLVWTVLLGVAALGLILVAVFGIAATIGFTLTALGEAALIRKRRLASDAYGHLHLGLFHPLDEVLSGMKVSLRAPGKLVPRLSVSRAKGTKRSTIPFAELLSRPLDQLGWQLAGRTVQGDDLVFENLASVSPSPHEVQDIPAGYEQGDIDRHNASTRDVAAALLADFRAVFAKEADAPPVPPTPVEGVDPDSVDPRRVLAVVDWGGIVHTSYFSQAPTIERIASRIAGQPKVTDLPRLKRSGLARHYVPTGLIVYATIFTSLLVLALGGLANQAATYTLLPFARENAVRTLFERAEDPRLFQTRDGQLLGNLFARLSHVDRSDASPFHSDAYFERITDLVVAADAAVGYAAANAAAWSETDMRAFQEAFIRSRAAFADEYEGAADDAQFVADIAIPLAAASAMLTRNQSVDAIVPKGSSSFLARLRDRADDIGQRGGFYMVMQALLVLGAQDTRPIPPELEQHAPTCGGTEDRMAAYLVVADEVRTAADILANCSMVGMARAWLLVMDEELNDRWLPLMVRLIDPKYEGSRFSCDWQGGDCTAPAWIRPEAPVTCGTPQCSAIQLLGSVEQPDVSVEAFLGIVRAESEYFRCDFPVEMALVWEIFRERANARQLEELDEIALGCLARSAAFLVSGEDNSKQLDRLLDISVAKEANKESVRSLAVEVEADLVADLEADKEGDGPRYPQASAALAGAIRVALNETERARTAISTGVDVVERTNRDYGPNAAWMIDLADATGDQGLLDRAYAVAKALAARSDDQSLAREVVTREMLRENYPAVNTLLANFAGNADTQASLLVGVADAILMQQSGPQLPLVEIFPPDPRLPSAAQ